MVAIRPLPVNPRVPFVAESGPSAAPARDARTGAGAVRTIRSRPMAPSSREPAGPRPAGHSARPHRLSPAFRPGARLATGALLLFSALAGLFKVKSYDVFWHLASGRWIVEHGRIPRTDPFRFTSHGAPWVDHEWLFQVLLYSRAAADRTGRPSRAVGSRRAERTDSGALGGRRRPGRDPPGLRPSRGGSPGPRGAGRARRRARCASPVVSAPGAPDPALDGAAPPAAPGDPARPRSPPPDAGRRDHRPGGTLGERAPGSAGGAGRSQPPSWSAAGFQAAEPGVAARRRRARRPRKSPGGWSPACRPCWRSPCWPRRTAGRSSRSRPRSAHRSAAWRRSTGSGSRSGIRASHGRRSTSSPSWAPSWSWRSSRGAGPADSTRPPASPPAPWPCWPPPPSGTRRCSTSEPQPWPASASPTWRAPAGTPRPIRTPIRSPPRAIGRGVPRAWPPCSACSPPPGS